MIHKIHMAKKDKKDTVKLWGTGNPLREFLYVDDLSDALVFIEKNKIIRPLINIGSNQEIQISELAFLIAKIIGFEGKIDFDRSMPDGMKRKIRSIDYEFSRMEKYYFPRRRSRSNLWMVFK